MKNLFVFLTLVCLASLLGACGGGSSQAADQEDFVPELRAFDMIDSYDVDTATSNEPLTLSPYLYDGLFEVFWKVNSLEDYRVSLRINDRDDWRNSITIATEICGEGLRCDQAGNWVCEYTSDFYMSCDVSSREVDINELFDQVPEDLYLLLEVCDTNSGYCEYDSYPVRFE